MTQETYWVVSIIISSLTIVGLAFAGVQLLLMKKNRKDQYDLARREKTVEMIQYYIGNISRETSLTNKIVSEFTEKQCKALYDSLAFIVDKPTKDNLCKICPHSDLCKKNTKDGTALCAVESQPSQFRVDGDLLIELRGNVMRYLNTLESVLLAWELGIVDRPVIENEFRFLDKKSPSERALEFYRRVAGGGHSFPAIERYYQNLSLEELEEAKKALAAMHREIK